MKTMAIEWPEVRFKAVDIALPCDANTISNILFSEMIHEDGAVEIGWERGKRYGLSMNLAPLPSEEKVIPELDWVVLVTGGARGITSHITLEIARCYQPTLLLVGRSPLPADEEDDFLVGLESAQEVKQALIRKAKEEHRAITIPEVEAECRAIMSAKDVRSSLSALKKAGSTVHYHSLDVSDENGLTAFLEDIREQYGRLDGVVHGAGVIEDKLFSDKTWESFERVFSTKVVSTLVLAKVLPSFSPRFFFMFSSIAGVFGNRGQCDYAAANEVMNKTATWLEPHLQGTVAALNWGPWAGSGMATSEVQEQFKKRGVDLVDRKRGVKAFMREMTSNIHEGAAVLLGDGPWVQSTGVEIMGSGMPLLEMGRIKEHTDTTLKIKISLDTRHHKYLKDHCLDGNPVFPATMAMELMAEAAAFLFPGKKICALRDIRVLKGIVVDKESVDITVHIEEQKSDGDNVTLFAEIMDADNLRIFYRGCIELGDGNCGDNQLVVPTLEGLEKAEISCQELYEKWLFHGPLFQCISENHGLNSQGMKALLTPSDPARCLEADGREAWLLDPI
ncbi:MAG: SDR family NAD(P)-dependent oxidoreductase, partial [Desulfofustis sp.]|nr:SDR family NAD(P)-dependent oxidoreductase [Desulfofustis sp.]